MYSVLICCTFRCTLWSLYPYPPPRSSPDLTGWGIQLWLGNQLNEAMLWNQLHQNSVLSSYLYSLVRSHMVSQTVRHSQLALLKWANTPPQLQCMVAKTFRKCSTTWMGSARLEVARTSIRRRVALKSAHGTAHQTMKLHKMIGSLLRWRSWEVARTSHKAEAWERISPELD